MERRSDFLLATESREMKWSELQMERRLDFLLATASWETV